MTSSRFDPTVEPVTHPPSNFSSSFTGLVLKTLLYRYSSALKNKTSNQELKQEDKE